MKEKLSYQVDATLHSYAQIFFSQNKVLAFVILCVTFFTPSLGLAGLLAVMLSNLFAELLGFGKALIREGIFGFNALLLGLALAHQYQIKGAFYLLFVVAILLLLLITVAVKGFLERYGLPFLSFPFLFAYWIVSLSASSFSEIHLQEQGIFVLNEAARNAGTWTYQLAHCADSLQMPLLLSAFFRTLASTFFIQSLFGGMLIAAGILYFSRITFSLAFLGFASAFYCYTLFGANVQDITGNLQGSNFIFLGIALGCFFLIPNLASYLSVIILSPLLMMLLLFLNKMGFTFQLKMFTLAFSILTGLCLFVLQNRSFARFLHLVTIQYYNAEKTIYKYLSSLERFKYAHLAHVSLPFWGEWTVSQGYEGSITHLGDWSKALDFVIEDEDLQTYKGQGIYKEEFYCYNKPVVAPMDGYVYLITNHVEENEISGVNTEENWGNTLILNHHNGLYSQISHIKKDSFRVAVGDYVTRGTILATCGNSGRSPEPHIHFQLQTVPIIGAQTLAYPIAYFLEREKKGLSLKLFEVPKEKAKIQNVEITPLLVESFGFYPGRKIIFQKENTSDLLAWEVLTDAWNRTYIRCYQTGAYAYFVNDGTMFYFTDFEGDKNSLLFHFYLAAYRILLGYYPSIEIEDKVPLQHFNAPALQWIQDFFAPFYLFTEAKYRNQVSAKEGIGSFDEISLVAHLDARFLNYSFKNTAYKLRFSDKRIQQFEIQEGDKKEIYICVA